MYNKKVGQYSVASRCPTKIDAGILHNEVYHDIKHGEGEARYQPTRIREMYSFEMEDH